MLIYIKVFYNLNWRKIFRDGKTHIYNYPAKQFIRILCDTVCISIICVICCHIFNQLLHYTVCKIENLADMHNTEFIVSKF